jgi:hypothetical protein
MFQESEPIPVAMRPDGSIRDSDATLNGSSRGMVCAWPVFADGA